MPTKETDLPSGVHHIRLEQKDIYVLGTAHISHKSVEEVKNLIQQIQPDTVSVELCPTRYKAIVERDSWQQMNIFKIIKENKALFLLVQLIMSFFYRKIGQKLGVRPGAEMLEGIHQAQRISSQLVLLDRDVNITLKRVWGHLTFWHKCKLFVQLITSLLLQGKVDEATIEELKTKDQLEVVMESVSRSFPEVKKRLIDERDIYMAQKLREATGNKIVAIVGAGHVSGILENINRESDLGPLLIMPPRSLWPRFLKWTIPVIVVGLIITGFFYGGSKHSLESIFIWILVNGTFSSLGVSLALAHPLTILSAFVSAPLTSLNPTIAAGWVAGLVQTWVKKPTVADLEDLPLALGSVKVFWYNPLCRILLVVVLANLGSSLGTFVAGSWIVARFF